MRYWTVIAPFLFIGATLSFGQETDNEDGGETTTEGVTSPSSTSTTTVSTTSATPPEKPLKEPGCYWTPCKSPLTYDRKCPPETQEQNENDDGPCEGLFVRYQCCPRKEDPSSTATATTTEKAKTEDGESTINNVVPQKA